MQKSQLFFPTLILLVIVMTLGISSWVSPNTIVLQQEATPTITPMGMSPTEDSWIIVDLPMMPPNLNMARKYIAWSVKLVMATRDRDLPMTGAHNGRLKTKIAGNPSVMP